MSESRASRTLVKSPPELWSEISNPASLQRHMDQFGEIRITRLEPETAVAWEGEYARGTIKLEASGWGTKVSLTAEPVGAGIEEAEGADDAEGATDAEPDFGERVEPEPLKEPGTSLEPADEAVEAQTREPTVFFKRDKRKAEKRERRWPRRLARALRGWLRRAPQGEVAPVTSAQDAVPSEPEQPTDIVEPVTSEPEQPASAPAPGPAPEPQQPEQPASAYAPAPAPERAPEPHAPTDAAPQGEVQPKPEMPSTDALTAALDSLGQAHHRPFSRA